MSEIRVQRINKNYVKIFFHSILNNAEPNENASEYFDIPSTK